MILSEPFKKVTEKTSHYYLLFIHDASLYQ